MSTEPTRDPYADPTSVTELDTVTVATATFHLQRLKFGVAPDVYRVSVTDVRADATVDTVIGHYPNDYDTARFVLGDWVEVERERRRDIGD